jgi:transcription termination factor Rho
MAEMAGGVLALEKKGGGVLRAPERSFRATPEDPRVPKALVQKYGLVAGATVRGPTKAGKGGPELADVETVCGLSPEAFGRRPAFADLVSIDPQERFHLADHGPLSMRLVDLVAPIGKGTRGLVVSPPKAGKTMLLQDIARSIRAEEPEARIVVLLIDERPEEVTDFRRNIDAEVLASSSDQTVQEHVDLAELTLAHIRTELECGRDVVVLMDSLTRMARAFNLKGTGKARGRMMSGGVEAGAMEIPRRFFGVARNIEDGGSVTIIATALVDTGSRMDQLIFEEFKGTGNSEIVLERSFAEARLFPAIDVLQSGTRRDERLYGAEEAARIMKLRRVLADRQPRDALASLLGLLPKFETNRDFLATIPA